MRADECSLGSWSWGWEHSAQSLLVVAIGVQSVLVTEHCCVGWPETKVPEKTLTALTVSMALLSTALGPVACTLAVAPKSVIVAYCVRLSALSESCSMFKVFRRYCFDKIIDNGDNR